MLSIKRDIACVGKSHSPNSSSRHRYSTLEAQCLVAELSSDSEGVSHIHLKFYPQIENFNLDVVFKIIVSVVFIAFKASHFYLQPFQVNISQLDN